MNNYVRGAVSGLGLVNIWLALADVASIVATGVNHASAGQDG
jgi:hypothetical protein